MIDLFSLDYGEMIPFYAGFSDCLGLLERFQCFRGEFRFRVMAQLSPLKLRNYQGQLRDRRSGTRLCEPHPISSTNRPELLTVSSSAMPLPAEGPPRAMSSTISASTVIYPRRAGLIEAVGCSAIIMCRPRIRTPGSSTTKGTAWAIEAMIDDCPAMRYIGRMVENHHAAVPSKPPVVPSPAPVSECTNSNSDTKPDCKASSEEDARRWSVVKARVDS